MNKIQKMSSAVALGIASLATSYFIGDRVARMDDAELTKVLRVADTNENGQVGFGEAIQLVDENKDGHLSDSEKSKGTTLRSKFDATGRAMIESSENIDKALQTIEQQ